jgi:hypothetical protein
MNAESIFPATDIQIGAHTVTILPSGWRFDPRDTVFTIKVTKK